MAKKIVVGMSGGVDSSMSLLLLKQQGWEPVGVSLKLAKWKGCSRENACCTEESLRVAKSVCDRLGVEHHVYDVQEDFKACVMDFLVSELKHGRTPNPCAECNRTLKFKKLFEWARDHGIEHVATGHYAKSRANPETGKGELLRPKDISKDQTYGLSFLDSDSLSKIIFPLGDLLKTEVFAIAKKEGFEIFEKKKQSQDLCFVSGKDLPVFIKENLGESPGPIVDSEGNKLGTHRGLHFYTVGQRKRLGVLSPTTPYFVKSIDIKSNTLIVTKKKSEIEQKSAILANLHFISGECPREMKVMAQARYHQDAVDAILIPLANGKARVLFIDPIEAVTPGQVCALYDGDLCLGAGIIIS